MGTGERLPRRWSVEVDGIRWLPRLIDKARMNEQGRLGAYLLGHSPVDHAFMTEAGITTADIVDAVRGTSDDAAVLAALRARGWNEAAVRRWSDRFPRTYRGFIPLWDLDEGYVQPNALQRALIAAFRPVEEPLMRLVRAVRRAP
jgi:hypothetical protein